MLVSPPEVAIDEFPAVLHKFYPFRNKEIFPQGPVIISKRKVVEILDDGISDPGIIEVNLLSFAISP